MAIMLCVTNLTENRVKSLTSGEYLGWTAHISKKNLDAGKFTLETIVQVALKTGRTLAEQSSLGN